MALHTRGLHGWPVEGLLREPNGIVLVLSADIGPGVLHVSWVRQARPQLTIQVYTPPLAWPFSTWAILGIMSHLAPEGTTAASTEDTAKEFHTWQIFQDCLWRQPRGDLQVAPVLERLSLTATFKRNPDKMVPPSRRRASSQPP